MQVALASKKDRKGAKRKITWGNHLLLVAEMLDAVLAAQKATKNRQLERVQTARNERRKYWKVRVMSMKVIQNMRWMRRLTCSIVLR